MLREFGGGDFAEEVEKAEGLTAISFSSPWCPGCQRMESVVEELAAEYAGRTKIVKLDVSRNPEIPARFEVLSIPALVFFKEGKEIDRITVFVPKEKVKEKIEALI